MSKVFAKEALIRTSLLSSEVSYYQYLIVTVFLLPTPLFLKNVGIINLGRPMLFHLYLLGIISGIMTICLYLSISLIPYSEAIMISYTKSIFGVLFAHIFLREKVSIIDYIALVVCVLAIFFYLDPGHILNAHVKTDFKNGEDPENLIGIFLALLNGILGGIQIISIRKLELLNAHVITETLFAGIFGMFLSPLFIIPVQEY